MRYVTASDQIGREHDPFNLVEKKKKENATSENNIWSRIHVCIVGLNPKPAKFHRNNNKFFALE